VTADDIEVLSDAIGAATLSFGSPPDDSSDVAIRMIADGVGQQRQGPTLYSSLARDPDGSSLARAYGFIVKQADQGEIPRHPSLFAYLQPEHVRSSLRDEWPEPQPADDPLRTTVLPEGYVVSPEADLTDYYQETDSVPLWVATSERYIGSELAGLALTGAAPETTTEYKQAYDRGAAEALAELHELVAKHARPT
jgi:hypothetical protein